MRTVSGRVVKVTCLTALLTLAGLVSAQAPQADSSAQPIRVDVVTDAVIQWNPDEPEAVDRDGFVIRYSGQAIERMVELPPMPTNLRDAMRITLHVEVEPVAAHVDGPTGPSDRWTRMGTVHLRKDTGSNVQRIELTRFITGFGGSSHFEQDVTALAPMLNGKQTLELFISTYSTEPAWKTSMWLEYSKEGVGMRRPKFATQLFSDPHVTSESPILTGTVEIPAGLALPRLRILTTGHATDGADGDEFVSRTHILRIDGRTIAVWRPWSEEGGWLRTSNPTSGRRTIDGRELWSSDLDRTGWHPGMVVEPVMIPVPELTPGTHTVQLIIQNIRPKPDAPAPTDPHAQPDPDTMHHGYWVVSAMVVADEPWPDSGPPRPGTPSAKPPAEKKSEP
jgi:hypothetical protein